VHPVRQGHRGVLAPHPVGELGVALGQLDADRLLLEVFEDVVQRTPLVTLVMVHARTLGRTPPSVNTSPERRAAVDNALTSDPNHG
jgi:hypothetical protein